MHGNLASALEKAKLVRRREHKARGEMISRKFAKCLASTAVVYIGGGNSTVSALQGWSAVANVNPASTPACGRAAFSAKWQPVEQRPPQLAVLRITQEPLHESDEFLCLCARHFSSRK